MQLDRFLKRNTLFSQRQVRQLIFANRVFVNGHVCRDLQYAITPFHHIRLDQTVLQDRQAVYLMLNKPAGIVSATSHPTHKTVIDCLKGISCQDLHLAGRLDFNSTGLMLITNDGRWSRELTEPSAQKEKVYWVKTEDPISADYIDKFAQGFYFAYEDIQLRPAQLHIISSHSARVILHEGRYHQIKRMFGAFNNRVLELHRESIGHICLDAKLVPGAFRHLTEAEIILA